MPREIVAFPTIPEELSAWGRTRHEWIRRRAIKKLAGAPINRPQDRIEDRAMKIQSSQIGMASQHQALLKTETRESLKYWRGERRPDFEGRGAARPAPDQTSLSPRAQQAQPVKARADIGEDESLSPMDNLKSKLVRMLVKVLTGKDFKLFDPSELARASGQAQTVETPPSPAPAQTQAAPQAQAGYGLEYDYYASRYEYESVSFQAQGTVQTQDGQTIQFSVEMNLSREFYSERSLSIRAGDAKKIDPLILNFDGSAAQLSDTQFAFDLDSDGRTEQIALLRPGSGFLALDKNQNGTVDDGSELFGPATGNGFQELAAYDSDGNRFIDENDPIYDQLRIWRRNADGSQQLIGLGQKGVGAIYLGHLAAPFSLRDAANQEQAQAVSAGVFLNENGQAGTIQQIDFTA
jgi:hypothetical protein